jgi:hypothetical protein
VREPRRTTHRPHEPPRHRRVELAPHRIAELLTRRVEQPTDAEHDENHGEREHDAVVGPDRPHEEARRDGERRGEQAADDADGHDRGGQTRVRMRERTNDPHGRERPDAPSPHHSSMLSPVRSAG